jgi:hypothetical protein
MSAQITETLQSSTPLQEQLEREQSSLFLIGSCRGKPDLKSTRIVGAAVLLARESHRDFPMAKYRMLVTTRHVIDAASDGGDCTLYIIFARGDSIAYCPIVRTLRWKEAGKEEDVAYICVEATDFAARLGVTLAQNQLALGEDVRVWGFPKTAGEDNIISILSRGYVARQAGAACFLRDSATFDPYAIIHAPIDVRSVGGAVVSATTGQLSGVIVPIFTDTRATDKIQRISHSSSVEVMQGIYDEMSNRCNFSRCIGAAMIAVSIRAAALQFHEHFNAPAVASSASASAPSAPASASSSSASSSSASSSQ